MQRHIRRTRLTIAVLIVAVLAGCATWRSPQPRTGDAAVVTPPTAQAITAASAGIPADPVGAAEALVDRILSADPATAAAATGALLLRSGIPLVRGDGSVVATPPDDGVMLINQPAYVEFLWSLARSVRTGMGYETAQAAGIITGISTLSGGSGAMSTNALLGLLGAWGKAAGDPLIAVTAGSAIRALAAHRGDVFYPGATGTTLDMLSFLLLASHIAGVEVVKGQAPAAQLWPAVQPAAMSADDVCSALKNVWAFRKFLDRYPKAVSSLSRAVLGAAVTAADSGAAESAIAGWRTFIDPLKWTTPVSVVYNAAEIAGSLILLYTGLTFDINSSDGFATHFRHESGDHSKDLHLTADVGFDPALPGDTGLSCYQLAGLDIPAHKGKLRKSDGWQVAWKVSPASDVKSSAPIELLRPTPADAAKVNGAGAPLDDDGQSRLTLFPRTEKSPPKSTKCSDQCMTLHVQVKATLAKPVDMGPVKMLTTFVNIFSAGNLASAVTRLIKSLQDLLTQLVLPSRTETIAVSYHGPAFYVIYGSTPNFTLVLVNLPLTADLYSCTGVAGPWHGTAGADVQSNDWTRALGGLAGKPVPANTPAINTNVTFMLNPNSTAPQRVDILPWLQLQVTLYPETGEAYPVRGKTDFYSPAAHAAFDVISQQLDYAGGSTVYYVVAQTEEKRCPQGSGKGSSLADDTFDAA